MLCALQRDTLGKCKGQQGHFRPLEEELRKMTRKKTSEPIKSMEMSRTIWTHWQKIGKS